MKCKVCGKEQKYLTKGLCSKHYYQLKRHGKILDTTQGRVNINKYDEHDNLVLIHCEDIKGNTPMSFIIDKEDKDKVLKYKWCVTDYKYNYVKNNAKLNKRLEYYLLDIDNKTHKIIFINRNNLDFTRKNLKVITINEYRAQYKTSLNKSGVNGICYEKNKNKYRAYITVDTRRINLGHYEKIEDAIQARKDAEKLYF